ncbi:MAG TPA: BTAD domain-containing putative transcriptional regulator [Nitrospirota bacterium]|nr:BTAD domain-containing putative transcriptional regulator [Nitrospirota bacterium]
MLKKSPSIAKITRPTLPKVFPRERLFKLLDQGRERSVIWISGPAGSGKTTLVASYIEARRLPCLWYQIDEGDSDIATFFYYLGLAGKKAAPRARRSLPLLTPVYGLGIQIFAKRYFEDLYARLKQPAVLVLDNFQDVPAKSGLHEVIAHGLAVIPPGRQIIVISRSDPPAPFARLQASNQVMSIDWDRLRLTLGELSEVMLLQCTGPLPKETVRAVYEKTDGWAAGVVLLCQAVSMEAADSESIKNMQSEKVFNYLSDELFARIDSSTQESLLKTAFVPKLTPEIAGELTEHEDAGQILSELYGRNFFMEKRAQPEQTYQYHPLFREFLLSRARKTFSLETISSLRQNAARMIEASGQVDDAIELYRESGDWQGMVRLVLQNAQSLAAQGRSETLERWILALPAGMCEASPWLLYWRGICWLSCNPAKARPHFSEAYTLFKRLGDRPGFLMSWSGIVDSYLYEWDAMTPLKRWIREMKGLLKRGEPFPSPDIEIAVAVRMFTALFFIQPRDRDLPAWEEKMKAYMKRTENPDQRMMLSAYLLFYYSWTGDLEKMNKLLRDFDPASRMQGASPITRILWLSQAAVYSWFRAESAESLRLVEEALELSRRFDTHVGDPRVMTQAVFASLGAGDIETAGSYLRKIKAVLNPKQRLDAGQYHYISALYFAVTGDLASAHEHATRATSLWDETGIPFAIAFGNAFLAQIHILLNEVRKAAVCIDRAQAAGRQLRSRNIEVHVHLLEAQIAHAQGDERRMVRALRKGLITGREIGLLGVTWWPPWAMATLLAKALEHGIETEYVEELIRKRSFAPDTPPYHLENWPWPVKIYTFGRFSLLKNGKTIRSQGKTQKKPMEMLKVVIALGGREIGEQQIIDALWPDAEGDAARMLFKTTLYRLRQMIGNSNAIAVQDGRVTLDNRLCWVDAWAFERFLGEAEKKWVRSRGQQSASRGVDEATEAARLTEKALVLYQCPFLEADSNEPWTVSQREHLRMRYIRAVGRLGCHWEQTGDFEKAADCYQSALRIDELTEGFYQRLMNCYLKLGRKAEAIKTYNRCFSALKSNMGVEPSPETTAIYRNITQ